MHLDGEERADCFAKFVFLMSRDGCVAPSCGAMGLSAVIAGVNKSMLSLMPLIVGN